MRFLFTFHRHIILDLSVWVSVCVGVVFPRGGDRYLPERSGHQREGFHDLQHPGAAAGKLQRPRRRLCAQRNPTELQEQASA